MKFLSLLLLTITALFADWSDVQRISPDHRVEVTTLNKSHTRATFVSATADVLVIREKSGDRSIPKSDLREVRIADPARRIRRGLIWTGVGAAAGIGIGFAACPYCANEGHGQKYVGPGVAIGAGIGALGFLPAGYRTVYKQ